jgi:hypothetical protein
MFCNHCGKPVIDDSPFCPHCGKEISYDKPLQEDNKSFQEEKRQKIIIHNPRNAFGNAGYALSLIGFILFLGVYLGCKFISGFPCNTWYYFIITIFLVFGFIFSLVGLIVGIAKKKAIRKSITGLIISLIILILMVILVVFV